MTSNQAIMKRAHAHQHIFSCVAKRYALTTECHKINGKSVHVHDFFFVCAWSVPLLMHIRRIQYIFVSTSPCGLLLKLPVSRCRMHPSHTTERQTYSRLRVLFSAPFIVCLPCICLFLISRGTFSSLCSRFRSPLPLLPVDYCTPPRKSIIAIMTATSGIRIPLSDAITMDTGKLHGALRAETVASRSKSRPNLRPQTFVFETL